MIILNTKKHWLQTLFFCLCCTQLLISQELKIQTDWSKTKVIAKKENKPILIILTGSEWFAPCKKMDERVIENTVFKEYASKHLVLFMVDLPKGVLDLDSKVSKDFNHFEKKYKTNAMPALVLVDKNGIKIKNLKGRMFHLKNVMKQIIIN
ncbi:thioredoxin family protein [Polaribacter sp. R77954]|uniref:thioredoxin family protein n=1 Tax=Polaribacter sp. R77954 TaxID=3093870 RepID=UPI0037C7CB60